MGPFPHNAPKSVISDENPAGTDGFEFVEFASPNPQELRDLFTKMGYELVARHKSKPGIELWQQGDITYVLNCEPNSFASRFVEEHGPCAPSMAWRVADAQHAFDYAVSKGAEPYEGDDKAVDWPAIKGIGGSLIYFTDRYYDTSPYYWVIFGLQGLCQATGWPAVVAITGPWLGKGKRGFLMGIWNAHTSVGNIMGNVIGAAGLVVKAPGFSCNNNWPMAFILAACAMTGINLITIFVLRSHPNSVGLEELEPLEEEDDEVCVLCF